MISKIIVNWDIDRLSRETSKLIANSTSDRQVDHLERAIMDLATGIFGANNEYESAIKENHFEDPQNVIQNMSDVLANIKAHIKETGLPYGYRAPLSNMIISHTISLIVGILLMFIPLCRAENRAEEQEKKARSREISLVVNHLEARLRVLEYEFSSGLDSLGPVYASRGTYKSGPYYSALERYDRDRRNQWGHTVDTCLARLKTLGVNTDTLKIRQFPNTALNIVNNARNRLRR